jgi:hypothetical protein
MKDLIPLHHFLGISVEEEVSELFLHQCQYAQDIIERASKPCSTPVNTRAKVFSDTCTPVSNQAAYRSLTRALQYHTFTRPNISYTVQ